MVTNNEWYRWKPSIHIFLFISQSNPFFPNSQQDRGIIILICSRSADQGSQGSSYPPQLTWACIAGILQPHSLHSSHARTHTHLLDSSTWWSIQISNVSVHSLIPSWTFPEGILLFQVNYDVPQGKGSTVPCISERAPMPFMNLKAFGLFNLQITTHHLFKVYSRPGDTTLTQARLSWTTCFFLRWSPQIPCTLQPTPPKRRTITLWASPFVYLTVTKLLGEPSCKDIGNAPNHTQRSRS